MKKHVKKLSLSRETLSALGEKSLSEAPGGTGSAWSNCFCTNYSACCTNGCGTQLCW
ncbi:MAG: class I lanthipeptide [Thermoanaerobaculia bacterium]